MEQNIHRAVLLHVGNFKNYKSFRGVKNMNGLLIKDIGGKK